MPASPLKEEYERPLLAAAAAADARLFICQDVIRDPRTAAGSCKGDGVYRMQLACVGEEEEGIDALAREDGWMAATCLNGKRTRPTERNERRWGKEMEEIDVNF